MAVSAGRCSALLQVDSLPAVSLSGLRRRRPRCWRRPGTESAQHRHAGTVWMAAVGRGPAASAQAAAPSPPTRRGAAARRAVAARTQRLARGALLPGGRHGGRRSRGVGARQTPLGGQHVHQIQVRRTAGSWGVIVKGPVGGKWMRV